MHMSLMLTGPLQASICAVCVCQLSLIQLFDLKRARLCVCSLTATNELHDKHGQLRQHFGGAAQGDYRSGIMHQRSQLPQYEHDVA